MAFYGVRFIQGVGEIVQYDHKPEGGAKKILSDLGRLLLLKNLDDKMYQRAVSVFEEVKWRYLERKNKVPFRSLESTYRLIDKINLLVPSFLLALPIELIEKIAGLLPLDDLLQLERTSKRQDSLLKIIFREKATRWGICSKRYRHPKEAIQNCFLSLKKIGSYFDYRRFFKREIEVKNYAFSHDHITCEGILSALKGATYPQKAAFVKTAATYANSILIKSGPLISFTLSNLEPDRFSFNFDYSLIDVLTLYATEPNALEILANTIPRSKLNLIYAGRNTTVLVHAILRNDFCSFERLLERGANPMRGGIKAPLIYAIEWKRDLMVHCLLEKLEFLPPGISTTLFAHSSDGAFYTLLKKDPGYFLSKGGDKSYLLEVIKSCSIERLHALFSYHPSVNFKELSCAYKKSKEIRAIVLKKGRFLRGVLHRFSIMKPSWIIQLIKNKELDLLEKLLEDGVDPNLIYENKSLLYWACKKTSSLSSALMAELLMKWGAKMYPEEREEILAHENVHERLAEILGDELG